MLKAVIIIAINNVEESFLFLLSNIINGDIKI